MPSFGDRNLLPATNFSIFIGRSAFYLANCVLFSQSRSSLNADVFAVDVNIVSLYGNGRIIFIDCFSIGV